MRLCAWAQCMGLLLALAGGAVALSDRSLAAGAIPPGMAISHSAWTSMLRRHVRPGRDGVNRVDYAGWKAAGVERLRSYVGMLEGAMPSRFPRAAQKAFWINLYNAKTAEIVLSRYPVASIKDIDLPDAATGKAAEGPWKAHVLKVEGKSLSLDDISDKILQPAFRDPRIHYALNCLSIGCPNLLAEAYVPERLERQLDQAAAAFVNHPRGITIKPGRVEASSIYEWYVADFGGPKGVLAHLSRYAKPALRRQLATVARIDAYDYDWRLNDLARR